MERKRFIIPQVTDKTTKKEDSIIINSQENQEPYIKKNDPFVSPIYGHVKDVDSYPTADFNNGGRQYDYLRTGHKITEEDLKDYCVPKHEEYYGYKQGDYQDKEDKINSLPNQRSEETSPNYQPRYEENVNRNAYNNVVNNNAFSNNDNQIDSGIRRYDTQNSQLNNYQEVNTSNNYSEVINKQDNNYINDNNYQDNAKQDNNYQDNSNNNLDNTYSEIEDENAYTIAKEEMLPVDDFDEESTEELDPYEEEVNRLKKDTVPAKNKYDDFHKQKKTKYVYPSLSLLKRKNPNAVTNNEGVNRQRAIIDRTLSDFGIQGRVVNFEKGPTVTLFEVALEPGVKYSKVPNIEKDLQGSLAAVSIRIEAPIPGRSTVGIEVPNIERDMVLFGDMICEESFLKDGNPMNVILGMDVTGTPQYLDITQMPHGLIAGCTRSGKSVCINTILASIIYKAHPDDVKLILIDPKKVEFSKFQGLPHLATPIVTDTNLAIATMRWLVDEMEARYDYFSSIGITNYQEYLELEGEGIDYKHMPYLLLVIDEFADLMATGGGDLETIVQRLTAKARAAGIHLIIATQRPSVDVISGTIKSNLPTRIAFKVQKQLDSTIILDKPGAEALLGNGDMIWINEMGNECRIQGAYLSTFELKSVVDSIKTGNSTFVFTPEDLQKKIEANDANDITNDDMFVTISRYIVQTQNASINRIQSKFKCGFNRAQAIVEKLAELGVVSENMGSRARNVLMDDADLEDILSRL